MKMHKHRAARRPAWPCKEKIAGILYDRETARGICKAGLGRIYRTPEGEYFYAADGEPVRPCDKDEVVEALIALHVAPIYWRDFARYMPRVRAVAEVPREPVKPFTFEERKKQLEEEFKKMDPQNMPKVW